MKLKALVMTLLFAAGVVASVAVAKGPPPGKGKENGASSATESTSSTSTTTTPGKGKGKKKGAEAGDAPCKPTVSFVLKGEFAGLGAASAPLADAAPSTAPTLATFEMDVEQANSHGRRYAGETVTISVDRKTKFKRRGHAELEDFEEGDWLNVHVRACHPKSRRRSTTTPTTATTTTTSTPAVQPVLLAKQVIGKPKKSSDAGDSTTTGTTAP